VDRYGRIGNGEGARIALRTSQKLAVLQFIPLKDLGAIYGSLRVNNIEFDIHGNGEKCAGCSLADLHWYIEAKEVNTKRALLTAVEPFGGKILAISEYLEHR
jgi:hypothetical protein